MKKDIGILSEFYCDQCDKYIGYYKEFAYFSDHEQDLDFCSQPCQTTWTQAGWTTIYPDITWQDKREWKKRGFTPQQTQEWLNYGYKDAFYCAWLKNSKQLTAEVAEDQAKQLRTEYEQNLAINNQWLAKHYPNLATSQIYLNQQLEGVLDCQGYKGLETIAISHSVDRSKLEIKQGSYWNKGKTHATRIVSTTSAQTWLEQYYPVEGVCSREKDWANEGKTRTQITKLAISEQYLEGELDLSGWVNLQELNCVDNYLTQLDLSHCPQLQILDCSQNQLQQLDLSSQNQLKIIYCSNNYLTQITYPANPQRLIELDISSNNLTESNLTVFSFMENLEQLEIGNDEPNKLSQGLFNRFKGSCEPLQNLTKLERLDISQTDLDSGLEYLPASLQYFYCSAQERPEAKCQTLFNLFANAHVKVETYLSGEITNFPQQLQEYKQKITQARQLLQAEFQAQDQLIQELKSKNQALQTQIESQTQTIQTIQSQLQITEQTNQELTQQKEQLEQEKTVYQERYYGIQEELNQSYYFLSLANQSNQQISLNYENSQAQIQQLTNQKQQLRAELTIVYPQIQLELKQKAHLQIITNQLKQEVQAVKEFLESKATLKPSQIVVSFQEHTVKILHSLLSQAEQQIALLKAEITTKEAQIQAHQFNQDLIEQLSQEINSLQEQLAQKQTELTKLKEKTNHITQIFQEQQTIRQAINQQIKQTKQELIKKQSQCLKGIKLLESMTDKKKAKVQSKLKTLLTAQAEITKTNSQFAREQKTEALAYLLAKADDQNNYSDYLANLCQLQKELIELEIKLEVSYQLATDQQEQQLLQIIHQLQQERTEILTSYLTDKQEQIQQEQDQSKLELLQAELQEIKNLQG